MISTAVHIITITLMMVWNDPLNLPAHLFHRCLLLLSEVIRLIAASRSPIFYYVGPAPGSPSEPREPTGGLSHSRGVGVEAGSKVTKSIACELLSASPVVTHGGS